MKKWNFSSATYLGKPSGDVQITEKVDSQNFLRISEQNFGIVVCNAAACFKFFFGKRSSQNSVYVLTRSIAISAEVFCLRTEGTILVAFVPQPAIQ